MPTLRSSPRAAQRLLPPLAGLAATLALGMAGPAMPGVWRLLAPGMFMPLVGLVLAGGAGLIAYDLAQRTASPLQARAVAALPCALVAAALPGIGVPALLVALALGAAVAYSGGDDQIEGFGAQAAASLGLSAACLDSPLLGSLAALVMLALATRLTRATALRPANDNPPMERFDEFWWLPLEPGCATQASGTRPASHGE